MATPRRWRFVYGQTAWMLAAVLVLAVVDGLSLRVFLVASLVGFLVMMEFTAPFDVTPAWRRRLKWFVLLGLLVFAYVLGRRILELMPEGAMP
ncbi:hypothetical protein [Halorussus sp. MSC15.2]|uniref:hypothetical protein n=1 Tax=Halorussus sp. MSC15.2 TaxID=2283638 RepID=UPI0013D34AAF|nr:hypothetical protein [Halorussus sp. MSC15.2]NEU58121.1 hypothetical protein [Halorussus sp. MSC15.2]